MKSRQREYCEWIKDTLDADANIQAGGNVKVLVEDRGSIAGKDDAALAKRGILATVATTGHTRKPGIGASTAGDLGIEIRLLEDPEKNRRGRADPFTITSAAEAIKDALHWLEHDGSRLRYVGMARDDVDEKVYRMVVSFVAFTTLNDDPVSWGTGDSAVWGKVTLKKLARGGTAIFEPGRDGKARFVGTRDPHLKVDLTCEVTVAGVGLPEIGEPFEYGGNTYYATLADLTESGEDTSTVHLAGRTMN